STAWRRRADRSRTSPRRCRSATADRSPLLGQREEGVVLRDQLLERRPRVHPLDVGGELGPALGVRPVARLVEVRELGGDADVGDREALADEPVPGELALEVREQGRGLVLPGLLDLGRIERLAEEARTDDLLEEDLGPEDPEERGVAVLLEPERARPVV